jgi:hypothetical protein
MIGATLSPDFAAKRVVEIIQHSLSIQPSPVAFAAAMINYLIHVIIAVLCQNH